LDFSEEVELVALLGSRARSVFRTSSVVKEISERPWSPVGDIRKGGYRCPSNSLRLKTDAKKSLNISEIVTGVDGEIITTVLTCSLVETSDA
jgi:hypothetical protein